MVQVIINVIVTEKYLENIPFYGRGVAHDHQKTLQNLYNNRPF